MKTLKKTLSLVLVLAMVLSFGAVAASAADFSDAEDITYTEAVEVMVALGVIEGFDTGDFQPQGSFTREQAAKIIAYMLLGPETVEQTLSASTSLNAPFKDVAANRWSAGYINYCVSQGIISGYGDGNFGPTDSLTAYAWAKMLLCALGYDAQNEGLVGEAWMVKTSALAIRSGLISSEELKATFNRELATKYAFNTLKTDMVEYPNSGTTITTPDGTVVVTGGSTASVVWNSYTKDYRQDVDDTDSIMQFCELNFPKLKLAIADKDAFLRIGDTWTLGTKEIGFFVYAPVATYTKAVTVSTVKKDAGLKATDKLYVYTDGAEREDDDTQVTYTVGTLTTTIAGTGNGVITEVYETSKSGEYNVIEINTYVGEVTKVTTSDGTDTATIRIISDELSAGAAKGTLDAAGDTFTATTKNIEKEDIVLFTMVNGAAKSVSIPEAVESVKISKVQNTSSTVNKEFTADDETYVPSKNAITLTDLGDTLKVNNTVTVYLDAYGYYVYATIDTSSSSYVYVHAVAAEQGRYSGSGYTYYAQIVEVVDGEAKAVKEVEISKASFVALTGEDDDSGSFKGIAKTSNSSADVVTLTVPTEADEHDVKTTKGKVSITVGSNYVADNDTVFLFQSGTSRYTYTAYVGYKNVPSIDSEDVTSAVALSGGVAKFVFIGNEARVSTTENTYFFAYIDNAGSGSDANGDYRILTAYVNGEKDTAVKVSEDVYAELTYGFTSSTIGYFYTSDVTIENGIITELGAGTVAKTGIDSEGKGAVIIGGDTYGVNADTKIWTVTTTGTGSNIKFTFEDDSYRNLIVDDANDECYFTVAQSTGLLTDLYIVKVAG